MLVHFKEHPLVTKEAEALQAFGRERNRFFNVMPERGVLEKPLVKTKIYYDEFDGDPIPLEASALLNEVVGCFPVKQVIIGHEIPNEEKQKFQYPKIDIPWGGLLWGLAKIIVIGIVAVALLPLAIPAFLLAYDPQLIVVLNDGNESWVCLATWDELSA